MKENKNTYYHLTLILLFCLTVFVPLIVGMKEKDKTIARFEKRPLASFPDNPITAVDLSAYPEKFNTYYADHFGLRMWLTENYLKLKFSIGDSPSEDVTIGKEDWLFLGSIKSGYTNHNDPFGDYRNVNQYSQAQLRLLVKYFKGVNLWLQQRGIVYVFFIAPNKHTIYFDKLPAYINKVNEKSAADQLITALKQYTDIVIVDFNQQLIEQKSKHQIYHKYDTHWTHHGANIAQFEIFKKLKELFPDQITPTLYELKDDFKKGGDLAGMIGVYELTKYQPEPVFTETCTPIRIPADANFRDIFTDSCPDKSLTALIYRDSFFNNLTPYFSRQLNQATYLFEKVSYQSLNNQFHQSKPDIVIEEWVERHLPYVPEESYVFTKFYDRERFNQSDEILFSTNSSNEWQRLKMIKHLELKGSSKDSLKLASIGEDPIMVIDNLDFQNNSEYMLNIKYTSSVKSFVQVFYTLKDRANPNFSEINSIKNNINIGQNDVYIPLDLTPLGNTIRIDLLNKKGEVEITSLQIKKVEKLL